MNSVCESVCIGFIQTGAFFISREPKRTWAENPRHTQGEVRLLPALEAGYAAFPPLTLSPLILLPAGKKISMRPERDFAPGPWHKHQALSHNGIHRLSQPVDPRE